MTLKAKVAIITGGGRGIGAAIAKRFVADGARVCITDIRKDLLDKVAQSLPAGTVTTCAGDVTIYEDVKRMVDTAVKFGGKLDVLINNAGIDPGGAIADLDPELWRKVLEVNLTGPFLCTKAALPQMIKQGGGSIINIASLAGVRCLPAMPAYSASKGGLIMLTQQTALDYGPHKVRCNVVCPGGTKTEMLAEALGQLGKTIGKDVEGVFEAISTNIPLRRLATPDEITGVCAYLASDDSSFMTGAVLLVDGGAAVVDISGAALTNVGAQWGV